MKCAIKGQLHTSCPFPGAAQSPIEAEAAAPAAALAVAGAATCIDKTMATTHAFAMKSDSPLWMAATPLALGMEVGHVLA